MSVNPTIVANFVQAMNDKFENKTANKKNNISGDFASDTVSYPTVQAVKNFITSAISGKADAESLADVATSGSYTVPEVTVTSVISGVSPQYVSGITAVTVRDAGAMFQTWVLEPM